MTGSMKGVGPQDFIKTVNADPKAEGYPVYFNTDDFYDPTPDDGETESDRYRQIELYPSITLNPVTIKIKYIEEASELSDDTDEPAIPINDRMVLYYGALAHAWSVIARDEEMSLKAERQFATKLTRMMGNVDEGFDQPKLGASSRYLSAIRSRGLSKKRLSNIPLGGQSSYASPTYAKNIILEGGNITANFTVDAGITIDGRDISADGALLDSFLVGASTTLPDNTTGVVAQWSTSTYKRVSVGLAIQRGTAYELTYIDIITNGFTVAWSEGGGAILSGAGPQVVFSCDINGSNVRLLFDTTANTGINAEVTYTEIKTDIYTTGK
jgi:hypothetical protein